MIKGMELLTKKQQEHINKVNSLHSTFGSSYKMTEAWIDEDGIACVRCLNGDWYHYYEDETWG